MILNIKVPVYNSAFYSDSAMKQNLVVMNKIKKNYGAYINQAVNLTNCPKELIVAIIFTESAGRNGITSYVGASGLMQIKPSTGNDILQYEKKKGRLSNSEKKVLRKQIGSRLDCILKQSYMSQPLSCNNRTGNVLTHQDMFDAEFNILVGSIMLKLLIDQETTGGITNLAKVIIRYNKGYFYKFKATTYTGVLNSFSKGTEPHSYLLKVLGKNGLLDALTS